MDQPLILVTRPQPECDQLLELLRQHHLPGLAMPAIAFSASPVAYVHSSRWQQAKLRLAIFTSPRAVRFAFDGVNPPDFSDALVAAIGPATAAALQHHVGQVMQPEQGGYTSEALLESSVLNEHRGHAVLFAAPGGRRALFDGLEQRGWTVEWAYVYQRVECAPPPCAVQALEKARSVVSVWTSASAMRHLLGLLPAAAGRNILQGTVVVISERLAQIATGLGARQVSVAAGPGNEALLDRLLALEKRPLAAGNDQ